VIIRLDGAVMVCLILLILQVSMDLIRSVPNWSSGNKETNIKEEEDPLLITFRDLQETNEVGTYVQLNTFHSIVCKYI
jgi:hypothetical protein